MHHVRSMLCFVLFGTDAFTYMYIPQACFIVNEAVTIVPCQRLNPEGNG